MDKLSEHEFIGRLYDAALGRLRWADIMSEMAQLFGAGTSALYSGDPVAGATDVVGMHGITPDFVELYGTEFLRHDLWAQGAIRRGVYGKATLGSEVVDPNDWERSFFYNEFVRTRTGAFHLLGAMLRLEGGRVLTLGCHRPKSMNEFSSGLVARLDRVLPHFQRSAEVWHRLNQACDISKALDYFAAGLLQVTGTGRVVHANPEAQRILRAADGISSIRNQLRLSSRAEKDALSRMIGEAAAAGHGDRLHQGAGGHLRISRPSGKRSFELLVSPSGLERPFSSSQPIALLFITDPEMHPLIDPRALSQLYGLTVGEARIVANIAQGRAPHEIATELRVSVNTVRTLLARAMAKTETNSQLALARLVMTGIAGLGILGGSS